VNHDETSEHLRRGLSRRLLDSTGIIIAPAWWRAADAGEIVGNCRQPMARGKTCDGHLVADPTVEIGQMKWFQAHCQRCLHEVVAPNGKTLPRSSRRDEMPEGAWDRRINHITAAFGKREAA